MRGESVRVGQLDDRWETAEDNGSGGRFKETDRCDAT